MTDLVPAPNPTPTPSPDSGHWVILKQNPDLYHFVCEYFSLFLQKQPHAIIIPRSWQLFLNISNYPIMFKFPSGLINGFSQMVCLNQDPKFTHWLHLGHMSLKSPVISSSSASLSVFLVISLLKKPSHLSYKLLHILDFVDCALLVPLACFSLPRLPYER